ncbi:hypothetical protein P3T37_006934 [Kitasatospora sp. MAA4]|uniref:hypothetical protein n=1 Tax=Kitasatospora sp. MAA4 TaxID=3035093 RepID=UPI002476E3BC|nr:hypothetical protein [Kitasatospora sp. MAA4]MDH6137501.1 hypothetical protein [Kitasatospora sp. MAA4]
MSTNRPRRIDRDAAERLLARAADGTQGGQGALADLLAAVAAPGAARELVGEEAAVTAFRLAVHLTVPAPRSRRRTMTSCTPSRSLAAKVAAATLAATALGGVAVAASTGNLPVVLGGTGRDGGPTAAPTSVPSSTGRGAAVAKPLPGTTGSASAGTGTTPHADVSASPSPSAEHGRSTADPHPDKPTPSHGDGRDDHTHTPPPKQ